MVLLNISPKIQFLGIGRNEQGMSLPLVAQKSGTGQQGVIINTTGMANARQNQQ